MKRWDKEGLTITQRAILDRIKAIGPMTIQEIREELGASREGIRTAVDGLHAMKRIYVRGWPYLGTQRSRQWALRTGAQMDAPRPPAYTRPEYDKHFRERNKSLIARRRSAIPVSPFQGLLG